MKRFTLRSGIQITTVIFLLFSFPLSAQIHSSRSIHWEKEKPAKGIVRKHAHTVLFDSIENINVVEINPRKRKMNLVYHPTENVPTSTLAQEASSLAAINAGFFDVKKGGSVSFIKIDGRVYDYDTTQWKQKELLNGAITIEKDGALKIQTAGDYSQYTLDAYDDVLIMGPLLLLNDSIQSLPATPFVQKQHPRSCLCVCKDHTIKLITVDGRSNESVGMSLTALAKLAKLLECQDAINLDGGGSTTLWVKGPGIINMPSDNKKFDHEGERPVSNVITVY